MNNILRFNKLFCACFLIIVHYSIQTSAQTSLTGYITIQNSKGKSAYPAQIKSFGATDAVANQADGKFTLAYDKKQPGSSATLKVERTGYEIVNRRDLQVTLPKNDKVQRPVKLFLCPKGQWRKYADQYYKINIQQINKNYKNQLRKIQKQYEAVTLENAAYRQALFDLDEKRKTAESQAEEMAERFAKTNLDDATDRTATAHRLFTAGKLDSVLLVLNEKEILADIKKAEQEIASGKKFVQIGKDKLVNGLEAKEKIVEEFMIKARAHIIKLQWGEAERSFEIATTADDSHFENLMEYGGFLSDQNKFTGAKKIYEKCKALAKDKLELSEVLLDLGQTQMSLDENKAAKINLFTSLRLTEQLLEDNSPGVERFSIASRYHNIGTLYYKLNQIDSSAFYIYKSIELKEDLFYDKTESISTMMRLNSLGGIYMKSNEFEKAEKTFNECLEIFNEYQEPIQELFIDHYAVVKINLGDVYRNLRDYESSRNHLQEAITIYEKLVEENRDKFLPELARAYYSFGALAGDENEIVDAFFNLATARDKYEELAGINPKAYDPSLARVYNLLAYNKNQFMIFEEAKEYSDLSIEIYERLIKENPDVYKPELAITLANSAGQYLLAEKYQIGKEMSERAIKLFDDLPSDLNIIERAQANNYLSVSYLGLKDYINSERYSILAIEIWEKEITKNKEAISYHLAYSEFVMSTINFYQFHDTGENKYKKKSIEWISKCEKTLSIYPDDFAQKQQLLRVLNRFDLRD